MQSPVLTTGSALARGAVSGVYERRDVGRGSATGLPLIVVETVRLDIDGWYPQKMASGNFSPAVYSLAGGFVEWASNITETSGGVWEGPIRKWGDKNLLPHTDIKIIAPSGYLSVSPAELVITFLGGAPPVTRQLRFASPFFRTAEIEWDTVEGASRVTHINTGDHPNRPATLRVEPLSMVGVYSRAGVDLQRSPNESIVPLALADKDEAATGAAQNDRWSNFELNEAMKTYWSRYKARSQWAMWLLFAGLHEDPDTRGIMFDSTGTFKRQGAAAFNDWWLTDQESISFDHPEAHLHRRRFVTACHETGHCFDLIHSYEHGTLTWWPLGDDPYASSFMTRPEDLGTEQFFAHFEYRFSDQELQYIRHAPINFIEMGGPYYGDKLNAVSAQRIHAWELHATVRRSTGVFDFLEPVVVDLSLTNRSDRPQVIDENLFRDGHNLNIFVSRGECAPTMVKPYIIACLAPRWRVLKPGETIEQSVFVSAGVMGWHISEPGPYEIRAALNSPTAQALSNSLRLRVAAPRERHEEIIAQQFFTDEVGRALVFGGAAEGSETHAVLEGIADQFGDRPVARHAQLSLGLPKMKGYRVLRLADGERQMSSVSEGGGGFGVVYGKPADARHYVEAALRTGDGVDTLGTEYLARMSSHFAAWLRREGAMAAGRKTRSRVKERGPGKRS